MKILIVGSGAVGGYFGALLARAGNDVTFLVRGEHLKAINRNGLLVKSINGDFTVQVKAKERPHKDKRYDLIIFAVKGYDLEAAAETVETVVTHNTSILSLLNGLDSEKRLAKRFGDKKIIGGIAFIGSAIESPGVIAHTSSGSITVGEMDGEESGRCKEIKAIFEKAHIPCKISTDITKDIWSKMVWNVGFNAITAVTRALASDILADHGTRQIVEQSMLETVRVAEKRGVLLSPDLISKTIARTEKAGKIKTSMLQDIERGKRTEIDFINGAVIEIGKESGFDTPVNETLCGLVRFLERR
jgi:2-dehydropantoate 2-reductase